MSNKETKNQNGGLSHATHLQATALKYKEKMKNWEAEQKIEYVNVTRKTTKAVYSLGNSRFIRIPMFVYELPAMACRL